MPWSVHLDVANRLLVTVAWETLTDQDLLDHDAAIRRHAALAPYFRQLVDVRHVKVVDVQRGLTTGTPTPLVERAARAAVVGKLGAQPLAGRLLAAPTYARGGRVRLFARLTEAEAWFDLASGATRLRADPPLIGRERRRAAAGWPVPATV